MLIVVLIPQVDVSLRHFLELNDTGAREGTALI
jgi:hypothetical protein